MRRTLAILAMLSLASAAGCSSGTAPAVRLGGVRVVERTDAGLVLSIDLVADNTGPDPLPLRDVRYDVEVDGRRVFSGVRSAQATLRRFGSQGVSLPAVIPAGVALPASGTVRVAGDMVYLAPGTIAQTLFDAEIVRPSVSFSGEEGVEFGEGP